MASKKTTQFIVSSLVGLTEDDAVAKAQAAGYKTRVRIRDGKAFMGTTDARQDRINFSIEDGKVINATIG